MISLIEIMQGRLIKSGRELFPQTEFKEAVTGPGWANSVSPTREGTIAIALEKAKETDARRGTTFIQEFRNPASKINGPWDFSTAAYARYGLTKPE